MQLTLGTIGSGKTTRLIMLSAEKQIPILVNKIEQVESYKEQAKALGLTNFPDPILGKIFLALSTHNESDFSKKVIVDALEQHLHFIDTASFTIINNKDIQIVERYGSEILLENNKALNP